MEPEVKYTLLGSFFLVAVTLVPFILLIKYLWTGCVIGSVICVVILSIALAVVSLAYQRRF